MFLLVALLAAGLSAEDPFFLIRVPSQTEAAGPFLIKRDLFRLDAAAPADPGSEPAVTRMGSPAETGMKTADVSAVNALTPALDVVLLGTILRQHKRCALFSISGEIEVAAEGDLLGNGWRIEKITLTRVTIKTQDSSLMLALEGEDHE
jgi:hypothetical protein